MYAILCILVTRQYAVSIPLKIRKASLRVNVVFKWQERQAFATRDAVQNLGGFIACAKTAF